MTSRHVVRDTGAGLADCAWEADHADRLFYRRILAKAWGEVAAGLGQPAEARIYPGFNPPEDSRTGRNGLRTTR